jgi:multidrug efflux pump subunit AcrA (membrane-fusion protein)
MTARSVLHSSVLALLFVGLLAGAKAPLPTSARHRRSRRRSRFRAAVATGGDPRVAWPHHADPDAEVRARVSGIVVNRNFEQGSDVKAGDVLYELDARPFEIDVDAEAFEKATAVLNQEKKNAKRRSWRRAARLQSQLDIAIANVGQAEATPPHRATSHVPNPPGIRQHPRADTSGYRVGRALVTEGAGRSKHANACCYDSAARSTIAGLHAIGCRTQRTAARIRYRRVAKRHDRAGAAHSR